MRHRHPLLLTSSLVPLLLFAASCTHPAPDPQKLLSGPDAAPLLRPSIFGALLAGAPQDRFATVYVGPSSGCDLHTTGGPVVHATRSTPIAGRPFTFEWSVEAIPPTTTWVNVALLVSTRPLSTPVLLGPVAPGCRLHVHPDYVLTPGPLLSYSQATGVVRLLWAPPPELVGTVFYTQLVVARPGANGLGHLLSAPVAFEVGTK